MKCSTYEVKSFRGGFSIQTSLLIFFSGIVRSRARFSELTIDTGQKVLQKGNAARRYILINEHRSTLHCITFELASSQSLDCKSCKRSLNSSSACDLCSRSTHFAYLAATRRAVNYKLPRLVSLRPVRVLVRFEEYLVKQVLIDVGSERMFYADGRRCYMAL